MKIMYPFLLLCFTAVSSAFAQPTLVKDIFPGDDANPTRFYDYNGRLLFRADGGATGVELYISDGTEEGTMMVKDINPNPEVSNGNSNPDNYVTFSGLVYFKADDGVVDDEFWVTDGTEEGTLLVKDIQAGDEPGNPFDIILFNDKMYFTANDGIFSSELWESNGTTEGTQLVVDIREGDAPGNPNFKTVVGDLIYMTANDGLVGNELWVSDGTAEGTRLVKDIREGGNGSPSQYTPYNGLVYFRADNGPEGRELWVTDGTEEGTMMVKDINPGDANSSPDDLFVFGNKLFFVADDGVNGDELWMSDGTAEGTVMAMDINPMGDSDPGNFIQAYPDVVFFTADNGTDGEELWVLQATDDGGFGMVQIEDINPMGDSEPEDLVFSGYALYFSAETPEFGRELYRFSVEEDVPVRISDINPEAGDGAIDDIILVGKRLFFEANDGTTGDELWTLEIPLSDIEVAVVGQALASGDTINLGEAIVGQSLETTLTISNAGDAPLVFRNDNLTEVSAPFSLDIPDGFEGVIAPGASFDFTATFSPTEEGPQTFEVTATTSSFDDQTFTFTLAGTGIAAAPEASVTLDGNPVISGDNIDFGTIMLEEQASRELTASSVGNVPFEVSSVVLSDEVNYSVTEISSPLAPGEQDTFLVTFAPTVVGELPAVLTINSNDVNTPAFLINLTGTGEMVDAVDERLRLPLTAFPNPVKGRLTVRLGEPLDNGWLYLYDAGGRLVLQQQLEKAATQVEVGLSALQTGTYLLEVSSSEKRGTATLLKE